MNPEQAGSDNEYNKLLSELAFLQINNPNDPRVIELQSLLDLPTQPKVENRRPKSNTQGTKANSSLFRRKGGKIQKKDPLP